MNIKDLKYFVSVCEHKHFKKAAEENFVSQPALSIQLKKLEDELGVKLFERSNKKVIITEAGKKLYDPAKKSLQNIKDIKYIAKNYQDQFANTFTLGAFPTLAPYLFPKLSTNIRKDNNKLKLFLIEEKSDVLIEKLKTGKLDAAFLSLPINDPQLKEEFLFEDPFFLAAPLNSKLSKKKTISQSDLSSNDLILLDEGHCMRDEAINYCKTNINTKNEMFRATSLETLREMISMGTGITLIPKIAMRQSDNLRYIPFSQPTPSRKIGIVYRKNNPKHKCIEYLLNLEAYHSDITK